MQPPALDTADRGRHEESSARRAARRAVQGSSATRRRPQSDPPESQPLEIRRFEASRRPLVIAAAPRHDEHVSPGSPRDGLRAAEAVPATDRQRKRLYVECSDADRDSLLHDARRHVEGRLLPRQRPAGRRRPRATVILLAVMGSPDKRQIDGIGGADPLTSKVAIVSRSTRPGIDVDYLFCQVWVDKAEVSTQQNCGNILAGGRRRSRSSAAWCRRATARPASAIFMVNTSQTVVGDDPDAGRASRVRRRRGDRRRTGHGGADSAQLRRHRRLHVRRAAADRPRGGRRERRARHLHRQRHAGRRDARRSDWAAPATRPARRSTTMPSSRPRSRRSG